MPLEHAYTQSQNNNNNKESDQPIAMLPDGKSTFNIPRLTNVPFQVGRPKAIWQAKITLDISTMMA